jgi:hypothetical protein
MAPSLVLLADTLLLPLLPNVHLTHYSTPAAVLDTAADDGVGGVEGPTRGQIAAQPSAARPPERLSAAWMEARLGAGHSAFLKIEALARGRLRAHASGDPSVAVRVRTLEQSAPYDVKICSTAFCLLAQRRPMGSPPRAGLLFCRKGSERWLKQCARGPGTYTYGE